ncbi:unnamed protein product, partial [Mycena citricolor]
EKLHDFPYGGRLIKHQIIPCRLSAFSRFSHIGPSELIINQIILRHRQQFGPVVPPLAPPPLPGATY